MPLKKVYYGSIDLPHFLDLENVHEQISSGLTFLLNLISITNLVILLMSFSLHQFLLTKTTEANKCLKNDADRAH